MAQFISKHVACHVGIITVLSNRMFSDMLVLRIRVHVLIRLFIHPKTRV